INQSKEIFLTIREGRNTMKKISIILVTLLLMFVFTGTAKSQSNNSGSSNQVSEEQIYKEDEVDQKAEIIERPKVKVGPECGQPDKSTSGQVKIELVLNKSGKVTQAKLVKVSDCRYFNKRALELSKKIKFKPAVKDGKTVSQYFYTTYQYNSF